MIVSNKNINETLRKSGIQDVDEMLDGLHYNILETIYDRSRARLNEIPDWRRSPERIRRGLDRLATSIEPDQFLGKTFMDFGCGKWSPLAQSVLMALNGVEKAIAVDILPSNDARVAASLYDLLRDCALSPEKFCIIDTEADQLRKKLGMFNVEALRHGDWRKGIADSPVTYEICEVNDYVSTFGQVDLMASNSVLEHIFPADEVIKGLAATLRPGGVMVHMVDFSDHFAKKRKDPTSRWQFLCENGTDSTRHCNRKRPSEILDMMRKAGLDAEIVGSKRAKLPEGLRSKLLPEFQRFDDAELEILSARIVAKRPI